MCPMAATAESIKKKAHAAIDRLPEDVTWADVVESLCVIEDIEAGLADADAGRLTDNNEVRRRFGLSELAE